MISLGAKFADYGLTGGFAIVGQATLLCWVAPDSARSIVIGSARILGDYFDSLPESLVTPAAAVMTTVGLGWLSEHEGFDIPGLPDFRVVKGCAH
jgi:hypothetical protein